MNQNNNPAPNRINSGPELGGNVRSENRAQSIRRDTDKQKNFSVTLLDIDTTIFTHFNEVINPQIVDNGVLIKVPVNYASPERWKSIRKDGFMRDKQGKIQCPVISYSRTTMQRNDQLITFNRHLTMPIVRTFSEKNKYDKFSLMNRFAPVKEIYSVSMPDHVIVTYDFILWTEKVEQLNSIVEKINWATEEYWGDKKRFKFRTSISDYNFQTEISGDQDRVVKATFSVMVYTYLLPETFENNSSTTQKSFTPRKVIFNSEVVVSVDDISRGITHDTGSKYTRNVINSEIADVEKYIDKTDFQNGMSTTEMALDFQSEYKTKTGSIVTIDDGSGSSIFKFINTSFNISTQSTTKQLTIFVDDMVAKDSSVSTYESGSSLFAVVNNTYSGVTPTTGSHIIGYGNIK